MKPGRSIPCFFIFLLLMLSSLFSFSCGKKGPPSTAQQDFTIMVRDLQGEWSAGSLQLTGVITGVKETEDLPGKVKSGRVYYGKYSLSER